MNNKFDIAVETEKKAVSAKGLAGFRHFKELEDIKGEEVAITIEYCTNCHEHKGSTKHN